MRQGLLGDFVDFAYGDGLPSRNRKPGPIPVYGSAGVIDSHNDPLVKGPGVIVGRKGTVGSVFWAEQDFFPIDTTYYVVPRSSSVRMRYVYYMLKALPLSQMNTDVAVPGLNRRNALRLKVIVPSPDIQDRIVGILSTYDDQIENNRRRIRLLEQAARLLYKEWFVHLHFPGHEHINITNGVPEGWEKVAISTFCTVHRGASPRPINNFLGGTVPWFKIGDATASGSPFVLETQELVTEDGAARSILLPAQELILSNSATCGIPNFTGIPGCIHDGWLYFQDLQRIDKWFLYCCLHEKQKELLQGIGEGATQKNLNTEYVGHQLVVLPKSYELLEMFRQTIEPMFAQIFSLAKSNISLGQARDILLPRLINGDISA